MQSQPSPRRVFSWTIIGVCLTVAGLDGCGGSSNVQEIPEASKKELIRRKVDVEAGTAKSLKTGRGSKGRPRTP